MEIFESLNKPNYRIKQNYRIADEIIGHYCKDNFEKLHILFHEIVAYGQHLESLEENTNFLIYKLKVRERCNNYTEKMFST